MSVPEQGRSALLRKTFEDKYSGDLAQFRLAITDEPENDAEAHAAWESSRNFLSELNDTDPRRWQIVQRLATPIVQRLVEQRQRILNEREQYAPGYRRKLAAFYDEEAQGVEDDYRLAGWMEDMRSRPDLGGYTSDGRYLPPDPNAAAPQTPDIRLDTTALGFYKGERDRLRGPLTDAEKRIRDHDLG